MNKSSCLADNGPKVGHRIPTAHLAPTYHGLSRRSVHRTFKKTASTHRLPSCRLPTSQRVLPSQPLHLISRPSLQEDYLLPSPSRLSPPMPQLPAHDCFPHDFSFLTLTSSLSVLISSFFHLDLHVAAGVFYLDLNVLDLDFHLILHGLGFLLNS